MVDYCNYKGRLIKMMEPYPIYDRYDDEKIIGYTKVGDLAVVTYSEVLGDYYEVIIVSGEFMGVDTLALNRKDIKKSIFIVNHIDEHDCVYVQGDKVKHETI